VSYALRATAAMAEARAAHTATSLNDGNVLILGGFKGAEADLAGAELYDHRTGRFLPIAQPRLRRQSHTATRLADGEVLIAGGMSEGQEYSDSAEVYDPLSGTFSAVGRMTMARSNHEAVLLDDGRVLLVGGVGGGWTFLASAELYDPRTNSFTATGSMVEAREGHAAVKLADGRVLVVGGHRGRGRETVISRTVEIFDAATGRFEPTGMMATPRHKHDAVALADGRVLVLGGADERDNKGVYDSVEVYDPVGGEFEASRPMLSGRYKHRGTSFPLVGGGVLLAGGAQRAEVYDPATGESQEVVATARMAGQFSAAARLPDGRFLITGGYGQGRGPRADAWLIDPPPSGGNSKGR
jgi:hypothetical protein